MRIHHGTLQNIAKNDKAAMVRSNEDFGGERVLLGHKIF
jgi:hypothetical protein